MTLEAPGVPDPEPGFGSLQSCLVEGDPQSEKRAHRMKLRAVAISIALETLALAALVLFPLLGKGERIFFVSATPIPPYGPVGHRSATPRRNPHAHPFCRFCAPPRVSPTIVKHDPPPTQEQEEDGSDSIPGTAREGDTPGGLGRTVERPTAPQREILRPVVERHKVSELQQMAQLVHRVDPVYPPLAIHTRHEGRVELHAVIAADGTIQSLEVVSGDPFFIPSALYAVRQWRYHPTILNGRSIEVDTHITVIYTLSRE